MAQSPERTSTNNQEQQFSREEEARITSQWYFDTSHEGRTSTEYKALRKEVKEATSLDFNRFGSDIDYHALIYENSYVQEFMRDLTVFDLELIHENRKSIGLSDEQFERLLAIFDQETQAAFRLSVADSEAMTSVFDSVDKHFSPAEIKRHSNETLAAMKGEIDLQKRDIPHPKTKLRWFPEKKKTK